MTNLADARNLINVLTSDVVVACAGSAGTLSEVALALKNGKTVLLLRLNVGDAFQEYRSNGQLVDMSTAQECIDKIAAVLG